MSAPPDAGEPILLLHGQPGSGRDWELVERALSGRATTLAIDRPGWDGRSTPGGVRHSGAAGVARLDAEGITRATVVGLSFGGAVAAWIAVHHPERVSRLVLISPSANLASLDGVDRLLAAPVVGYLVSAALLSGAGLALGSRRIRRRFESTLSLPDDYLRVTGARLRSRAALHAFVTEQRSLVRELPDLDASLGAIAAPTTVVVGTADTIVPVDAGRRLARQIPGAELVEIDGGHHVLPAEHPHRLAELILGART